MVSLALSSRHDWSAGVNTTQIMNMGCDGIFGPLPFKKSVIGFYQPKLDWIGPGGRRRWLKVGLCLWVNASQAKVR